MRQKQEFHQQHGLRQELLVRENTLCGFFPGYLRNGLYFGICGLRVPGIFDGGGLGGEMTATA